MKSSRAEWIVLSLAPTKALAESKSLSSLSPTIAQENLRPGRSVCYIVIFLLISITPIDSLARFENVSSFVGIDVFKEPEPAFGNPLWVDLNNDGNLDLIANHHNYSLDIYLNDGHGGLYSRDVSDDIDLFGPSNFDMHGSSTGDYDNDGIIDLFTGAGGASGSRVPESRLWKGVGNGSFMDVTSESGICCEGRAAVWLDYNNDGLLDLIRKAPNHIILHKNNGDGTFTDVSEAAGLADSELNGKHHDVLSYADYDNDGDPDILFGGGPKAVFYTNNGDGTFQKSTFPDVNHVVGIAWGDYDNDGDLDVAVSRGIPDYSHDIISDPNMIYFQNHIADYQSPGELDFSTTGGDISFRFWGPETWTSPEDIFFGSDAVNPLTNPFTISHQDAIGHPDFSEHFTPGENTWFFVWSDENSNDWHVRWSNDRHVRGFYGEISLEEGQQVLDTQQSFDKTDGNFSIELFENNGDGTFTRITDSAGITHTGQHRGGIIFGDYDNDGDLDLYAVDNGSIADNSPNLLFSNNGDGTFHEVSAIEGVQANESVGRHYGAAWGDYDNDGYLDLALHNGYGWANPWGKGLDQLYRNLGGSNHWLKVTITGSVSNQSAFGSAVTLEVNGKRQLRYLNGSGGGEVSNQSCGPLHFGLGQDETVDKLTIKWPSGVVQSYENIPADQSLQIFEDPIHTLNGKPTYLPGISQGVFLWKDTFDGPYHLRVSGNGSYETVFVALVSTSALGHVTPYVLESGDTLSEGLSGLSLISQVSTSEDGVDFSLAPDAQTLIAIQREGVANTRRVYVGPTKMPLMPSGWILKSQEIPKRPTFYGGQDQGLFVGWSSEEVTTIEALSNGDGQTHRTHLSLISSEATYGANSLNFESNDSFQQTDSSAEMSGRVSTWWDGLQMQVNDPSLIGIAYEQDELFPVLKVNPSGDSLGVPNAYWLPLALPYDKPEYDASSEASLFIWSNHNGLWSVRGTAGGLGARYKGEIVSDKPFKSLTTIALEGDDQVELVEPNRIVFDVSMWQHREDGFEFSVSESSTLHINLDEGRERLRVGGEKWPVNTFPLDLSHW